VYGCGGRRCAKSWDHSNANFIRSSCCRLVETAGSDATGGRRGLPSVEGEIATTSEVKMPLAGGGGQEQSAAG
jgi:hypothetical protein